VGQVILLRPRSRLLEDLPVSLECLGGIVQEFHDLRNCIDRVVRDPPWLAPQWRVACAPFMLRLPKVRQSLVDLAKIGVVRWPDVNWALRLCVARHEVEWRLLHFEMSMSSLIHGQAGSVDTLASFVFDGTKLATAAAKLCTLIASQYPMTADQERFVLPRFHARRRPTFPQIR